MAVGPKPRNQKKRRKKSKGGPPQLVEKDVFDRLHVFDYTPQTLAVQRGQRARGRFGGAYTQREVGAPKAHKETQLIPGGGSKKKKRKSKKS